MKANNTQVLQPIMTVEITIPEEFQVRLSIAIRLEIIMAINEITVSALRSHACRAL